MKSIEKVWSRSLTLHYVLLLYPSNFVLIASNIFACKYILAYIMTELKNDVLEIGSRSIHAHFFFKSNEQFKRYREHISKF